MNPTKSAKKGLGLSLINSYLCAMDIVVIGSGGVAESLVFSLTQAGVAPRVIVSPTPGHAERLRDLYAPESSVLHDLVEMPRNADIYLLAVTDTAIASCATQMPSTSGVWLHTAACVPVETLIQYHPDSGIFYPLNTFSKGRPLSWQGIPLFVEHRSEITNQAIQQLAKVLHVEPRPSTLTLRQEIHVAAVFACNFVNHQWAIASELLEQHQIPREVLHPLIQETLQKAIALDPRDTQTGPALRGDTATLAAHRALLAESREAVQTLYDVTSQSIWSMYHPETSLSHE
ncbi:Rossmann-like and DUF2520 domain-containing protein [Porphyromonas endodontalis]